jgi:hypothetical protein
MPPRKLRAVSAILGTRTLEDAARVCGISRRTISRWAEAPEFQAALLAERRAMFGRAIDELRVASGESVAALRAIITSPDVSPAIVVQAASAILSHAFRGVELVDVLERLNKLEEASEDAKNSR